MVRRTKEDTEATKEAILDAAAEVFVNKGVARTSLQEIATKAGVTRGAIYWHFKNKVDIFAALHEQLFMSFSEMILEGLEKNHPHPLKQIEKLCVELLLDLERNPKKRRVLTIFFLKCDYSGEMERFLECQKQQKLKSTELFSCYFKRAIERGYLACNTDPMALTRALSCYMSGILCEYLRNPELLKLKEQAASLLRIFFNGLIPNKQN